jgi:hypothetical protein
MQDPEADMEDEIEWIDEWEDTNRLPYSVEVTLWMDPVEEDDDPIELKRVVQVPLAPLSWGRSTPSQPAKSGSDSTRERKLKAGQGSGNTGSGSTTAPRVDTTK